MDQPPSFTDTKTTYPADSTGYRPGAPETYDKSTRYFEHPPQS